MDNPTKNLGLIAGAIVSAGTIYGVITFTHDKIQLVDTHTQQLEQQSEEIKQVRGNVLIQGIKEEIRWTQRRLFRIEDVYGDDLKEAPTLVREEYKQDKIDMDNLQQELKATQRAYKALR